MLSFSLTEEVKYHQQFPVHYSLDELSNLINQTKSLIDKPKKETKGSDFDFSRVSTFFEMSKMLKKKVEQLYHINKVSNAYLKIYEILSQFPEIINNTKSPIYRYFDNASFPGAFIRGTDHYIKSNINEIKYLDWFASSLYTDTEGVLGDEYNLLFNYPFRWLMDKTINNGDVSNPDNILDFRHKFQKLGFVSLYTSDLGFDVSSDYSKQEVFHLKPNVGQISSALESVEEGGCQITKQFTFFELRNRILLYLLTKLYKNVNIIKPITSKPDNSEIYILCIGYNRTDNLKYRELLLNSLKHWDKPILEEIVLPKEFEDKLIFIANEIYLRQVEKIKFNIKLFYNLQRNPRDRPNFVNLPSDFYNSLKNDVNIWLKSNPMKTIINPLPITKTEISDKIYENNIILSKSEWNNYIKSSKILEFYNLLFMGEYKPIYKVYTLYGKTIIYNETNKQFAILLFNLLIKCGGLLRKLMLFILNTKTLITSEEKNININSLNQRLKSININDPIWNKFKKFLSNKGLSFEKFNHSLQTTNNDIDFLHNLKIDYKPIEKNKGRELSRLQDIQSYLNIFKIEDKIEFVEIKGDYTKRTLQNVKESDGTLIISTNFNTPGEKLTMRLLKEYKKPYMLVEIKDNSIYEKDKIKLQEFIDLNKIKVLNIAGNNISRYRTLNQSQLDDIIYDFLKNLSKIDKIISGGQSGADESGIKAGIKLNIKTRINLPEKWMFRDKNGTDIYNRELFIKRFNIFKYLDLGSSEGNITSLVVSYLNLPKENAIAMDIKDEKEEKNYPLPARGINYPLPRGINIRFPRGVKIIRKKKIIHI